MLCEKERCFATRSVSLEELVPANHFYRQLEAQLDLRFLYDLVQHTYATSMGRPSIDPVAFFKLQLIMFFEGIRSERQLIEAVNVNLAHRLYIGYDLDEVVPDHSSARLFVLKTAGYFFNTLPSISDGPDGVCSLRKEGGNRSAPTR